MKGFTEDTFGSTEKAAQNREAGRNGGEQPRLNTQSKAGWEPKPESGSQLACFILMRCKITRAYYFATLLLVGFACDRARSARAFF